MPARTKKDLPQQRVVAVHQGAHPHLTAQEPQHICSSGGYGLGRGRSLWFESCGAMIAGCWSEHCVDEADEGWGDLHALVLGVRHERGGCEEKRSACMRKPSGWSLKFAEGHKGVPLSGPFGRLPSSRLRQRCA